MLQPHDFNKEPVECAIFLIGKTIKIFSNNIWLSALIIETEAYDINEKASHASLGFTEKKKALFMEPGTIYMYYARGKDSLNISCKGPGNAVLIKSAYPYRCSDIQIATMQNNNPLADRVRNPHLLCAGQTLLCKSLGIKVSEWDKKQFDKKKFFIARTGHDPKQIVKTTRLGIPKNRDEHLMYRFIHLDYVKYCTSNPLNKKNSIQDKKYYII